MIWTQKKLKQYFSDYISAYAKIRCAFKKRGFEHEQGSGYVSKMPLSIIQLEDIVYNISQENPWLKKCYHKFCVADIKKYHDLNLDFDDSNNAMETVSLPNQTPPQNSPAQKAVQRGDDEPERD